MSRQTFGAVTRTGSEMDDEGGVGYGRPPRHTRFKPGQSGNPKGRPKGRKNIRSEVCQILTEPIPMKVGGKRCRMTRIAAILKVQAHRALNGDLRSAVTVLKIAKELGVLDQTSTDPQRLLSPEQLERISDETLQDLLRIERELEQEAHTKNSKKPH